MKMGRIDEPIIATAVAVDSPSAPFTTAQAFVVDAAIEAQQQHSQINETAIKELLSSHSWPQGLQDTFIRNANSIAMRYIICDDSGSMADADGHLPLAPKSAPCCSRWEELTESLRFMLEAARAADIPTEFRLLNGSEPILIGGGLDRADEGYAILKSIFDGQPRGGTPLCKHVKDVIAKIRTKEAELRSSRRKACVVICTDGISSDGDLLTAMKPFETLPVWVVIRLCTDDKKIVEYWNEIDHQLEVELDVLDDFASEAEEVVAANPFITYGLPLHRMREFGLYAKEFDILDSANLSHGQMHSLVAALLGGTKQDYPNPAHNFEDFMTVLNLRLQRSPLTPDPCSNLRKNPWIKTGLLRKKYGPPSTCTIS